MPKEFTKCPRCGSLYIRASYSKAVQDLFFSWFFNKVPFRCRNCRFRFYLREPEKNTEYFRSTEAVRQWTERLRNRHK